MTSMNLVLALATAILLHVPQATAHGHHVVTIDVGAGPTWVVDGVTNPQLNFTVNETYTVVVNAAFSVHPLEFRTESNLDGGGDIITDYSDGVVQGTGSYSQNITFWRTGTIYYYCINHPATMEGMVVIGNATAENMTTPEPTTTTTTTTTTTAKNITACNVTDAPVLTWAMSRLADNETVPVETSLMYDCDTGYWVGPGDTVVEADCLINGSFAEADGECTRIMCMAPGANVISNSEGPDTNVSVPSGTVVTYDCLPGHHVPTTLAHSVVVTCQEDGTYTTTTQTCDDFDACAAGATCPFGADCHDRAAPDLGYDCRCREDQHEALGDDGTLLACLDVKLNTEHATLKLMARDLDYTLFNDEMDMVTGSLVDLHEGLDRIVLAVTNGIHQEDLDDLEASLQNEFADADASLNATLRDYIDTEVGKATTAAEEYADERQSDAEGYADGLLVEAKGYSDDRLSDAEAYTDGEIATAKTEVNGYTDTEVQKAKDYTDGEVADAKTELEGYTDVEVGKANDYTDDEIVKAKQYADNVLADAKAYTDNEITDAKAYADTQRGAAITQANGYTDTEVADAKAYADTKTDDAKAHAESFTTAAIDDLDLNPATLGAASEWMNRVHYCAASGEFFDLKTLSCTTARSAIGSTIPTYYPGDGLGLAAHKSYTQIGSFPALHSYDVPGGPSNVDLLKFTLYFKVWFKHSIPGETEVFFETGADGTGFAFSRQGDNLVVGNCHSQDQTISMAIPPEHITDTPNFVHVVLTRSSPTNSDTTANRRNRKIRVYINNVQINTEETPSAGLWRDWSGTDALTIGMSGSACKVTGTIRHIVNDADSTVDVALNPGIQFWFNQLWDPTTATPQTVPSWQALPILNSCSELVSHPTLQFGLLGNGWVFAVGALQPVVACHLAAGGAVLQQAYVAGGPGSGMSQQTPARSCMLLRILGDVSGVRWIEGFDGAPAQQMYCDQQYQGGGWALCGKFDQGDVANDQNYLVAGFAREAQNAADMLDPAAFSQGQGQYSVDCRGVLRDSSLMMHVGDSDGRNKGGYDLVRFTTITSDVAEDPTNFWDVTKDVDDNSIGGTCMSNKIETYQPGFSDPTPGFDNGNILGNKAIRFGTGTYFRSYRRAGTAFSNAGNSDCRGSKDDTVYWHWQYDGAAEDHGCATNNMQIGTGCNLRRPTHRYNMVWVR
eukprot:m.451271 g.451271  ORF g.451271 m.451271 type:complete len:1183 (-) comp20323_c0_seq17:70-3618(-)